MHSPCAYLGGERSWELRRGAEPGIRVRKGFFFNVCPFVVQIKIYFYINTVSLINVNENCSMCLKNIYLFTDGK